MGKPFETNSKRLCPVYEKIKEILVARGWEQKAFHASKVPQGDMCFFKFEGIENVLENKGEEFILFSIGVNIEGLNKASGSTCIVNITMESYNPKNKFVTINHPFENKIMALLEEHIQD
ncbi:MAG: hypothetical protein KAR56_00455 [Thermoplasmata archaeon]|nr:hypothetical protein [Thermoplasmata archaeon]